MCVKINFGFWNWWQAISQNLYRDISGECEYISGYMSKLMLFSICIKNISGYMRVSAELKFRRWSAERGRKLRQSELQMPEGEVVSAWLGLAGCWLLMCSLTVPIKKKTWDEKIDQRFGMFWVHPNIPVVTYSCLYIVIMIPIPLFHPLSPPWLLGVFDIWYWEGISYIKH